MMDEKELKVLLEEYKELGHCWRHDDRISSIFPSILLPLAFAALTLPYLRENEVPKWLCSLGGMTLITFWFCTYHLYRRRAKVGFARIYKLEEILDFNSHLSYDRELGDKQWNFKTLYLITFVSYLVIASGILIASLGSCAWQTMLLFWQSITLVHRRLGRAVFAKHTAKGE